MSGDENRDAKGVSVSDDGIIEQDMLWSRSRSRSSCSANTSGAIIDDISMSMTTNTSAGAGGISEITEIIEEEAQQLNKNLTQTHTHHSSLFSNNIGLSGHHNNLVYVAVGKGETSMDALLWTLTHAVIPPTTLVYLVHIFSHLKFFPSPLGGGKVPKSQVSPELAETYLAQDKSKRRELLTKYMDKCTTHMVQVETILIESDSVTDAITELFSVLNIPKLVIGISKSNLRKLREGKGKGSGIVADEIVQRAPAECEVMIICQGKKVSDLTSQQPSSPITSTPKLKSPAATPPSTSITTTTKTTKDDVVAQDDKLQRHPSDNASFSCCFRPSF